MVPGSKQRILWDYVDETRELLFTDVSENGSLQAKAHDVHQNYNIITYLLLFWHENYTSGVSLIVIIIVFNQ